MSTKLTDYFRRGAGWLLTRAAVGLLMMGSKVTGRESLAATGRMILTLENLKPLTPEQVEERKRERLQSVDRLMYSAKIKRYLRKLEAENMLSAPDMAELERQVFGSRLPSRLQRATLWDNYHEIYRAGEWEQAA